MSNHNRFRDGLAELGSQGRALRAMIPDVYRGFSEWTARQWRPTR
jgi:hypothetical protein